MSMRPSWPAASCLQEQSFFCASFMLFLDDICELLFSLLILEHFFCSSFSLLKFLKSFYTSVLCWTLLTLIFDWICSLICFLRCWSFSCSFLFWSFLCSLWRSIFWFLFLCSIILLAFFFVSLILILSCTFFMHEKGFRFANNSKSSSDLILLLL
ncbi:unnamed protein product [Moneuplotes crassus]|uniref:Uncharacterized protein n=1 Tax=Euplotes crassus TaxID=5936 RepID=A0AAD1XUT9_EUPCR|nr:unnamed protein product [Moneuplotes crassus]